MRQGGIWLAMLATVLGCGRSSSRDRYIPAVDPARLALKASLDAWQGATALATESSSPRVEFEDSRRLRGRRLRSYEIVGEVSGEDGRWFEVVLDLDQPMESVQSRYVVIGIDPLLVASQQDYENTLRWDHDMAPSDTPGKVKTP